MRRQNLLGKLGSMGIFDTKLGEIKKGQCSGRLLCLIHVYIVHSASDTTLKYMYYVRHFSEAADLTCLAK